MKTAIYTHDYETNELEQITAITQITALAVAPKYIYGDHLVFAGWNLYAIDGDKAVLLETYDEEKEALWVRENIIENLKCGAVMVII